MVLTLIIEIVSPSKAILTSRLYAVAASGSKVPKYRVSMVSVGGIVIMLWGICCRFWYLHPWGYSTQRVQVPKILWHYGNYQAPEYSAGFVFRA